MSTPPAHPPPAPSWPHCGHGADPATDPVGCQGIHVPGHTACLAHLSETDRNAYVAGLAPGADIDHRGTPITEGILTDLLNALRDPTTGKPHIGDAQLGGAQFSGTARFGGVQFLSDASFGHAQFADDAWFGGVQFAGAARFDEVQFSGHARFGGARFSGQAGFGAVQFASEIQFDGAQFFEDAKFGGAQFTGDAGFLGAQFSSDADFDRAQFSGDAGFGGARFSGSAGFVAVQFSGDALFGGATFSRQAGFGLSQFAGEARFDGAQFSGDAWFEGAQFSYHARFDHAQFFDGARFGGATFSSAGFGGVQFAGTARFGRAKFSGDAKFDHAQFSGDAEFLGVQFADDAGFGGVQFASEARFDGARFSSDVEFLGAQFCGNARFVRGRFAAMPQFGPMVCARAVDLSGAVFEAPVTLEIAAQEVLCERTRWESTTTLRLRYATVDLSHAVLSFPVAVTAHPAPFTTTDTVTAMAVPESLLAGHRQGVRVVSVRGVDAAHLMLTDTDLSDCLFSGAFHLDQLRLEGRITFSQPPNGVRLYHRWPLRYSRRRTLAEEHHWRRQTDTRSLWPRDWRAGPHHPDPNRTPDPEDVAALYRQLRKAFEDGKNEPGAADFYYGEMEMRRHDHEGTPPGERGLLWGYWLLSGYGLRASRALGWLLAAIAVTIVLMMGWGLPTSAPKQTATGTVPASGGRVSLIVGKSDPELTLPFGDRFNEERFDKTVQVVLNSVVFRSSGQDLTTVGTYTEMISRFTEPVLLALAVLAMRSRIKR
ncbi:pentapeptide repeat-containing protein [Streptomyces krungchingensis]